MACKKTRIGNVGIFSFTILNQTIGGIYMVSKTDFKRISCRRDVDNDSVNPRTERSYPQRLFGK